MSFHGGLAGVILAMILFARRRALRFFVVADVVAGATPIGLFLGRLANFINGELYGRVSDVPWAMVFPHGGPDPRHPSQLYQAGLEGIALFLVLFALARVLGVRERPGFLSGAFLAGYGVARMIGELFRQPDIQIGFLTGGTTMGQWLSLPMIAFGVLFMVRARKVATGA
jgi:phosphatidylglycerol:prolipoprotein diacylglycerol transferase